MTQIEAGAGALLARGAHLVAVGGDHTIALPLLRATAARHGPLALVHFDAHLDTWDTYFGQRYTHGTPFRRAWEEGLLLRDHSMHVGLRGPLYDGSDLTDDVAMGFAQVTTDEVADLGVARHCRADAWPGWAVHRSTSRSTSTCSTRRTPRAPGTPEAGGLTSRELLGPVARPRGVRPRRGRRGGGLAGLRPCGDHRGCSVPRALRAGDHPGPESGRIRGNLVTVHSQPGNRP